MKEVKIYTIVSDQLSPPITGESFCTDMVRHSDYAELEAKYAALAEDNDKAMESLKQADAVVKLAHEKFSALAAENAAMKSAKEIIRHLNANREEANFCGIDDCHIDDAVEAMLTPATDAFLAEVRAQSADELAELYFTLAAHEANRYIADSWRESARFAKDHAAQLRQEAAK
ncbi:TPA: Eae-like protein [Salmonella enterica subsp. diarizonae serovar 61:l,v:1,5,7]